MDDDRTRWDQRWQQRAGEPFPAPARWLATIVDDLPRGRALDVACGRGRNALLLAARGWQVEAVDISAIGLDLARAEARRRGLDLAFRQVDLDGWAGPLAAPDLVVVFRYTDPALVTRLAARLRPGGALVSEQHVDGDGPGPRDPRRRWRPGVLRAACAGLRITFAAQVDDDGACLERVIARRDR